MSVARVGSMTSLVTNEVDAARGSVWTRVPRNGWIDALRGWAVISVVLLHLNIRVPFKNTELGAALGRPLYNLLFFSGYYGVIVFFVISGFLITGGALARWGELKRLRLRDFYVLRFARILPCLLLFIAAQSLLQLADVGPFTSDTSPTSLPATILSALTFHLNWIEARDGYLPGAWDVLWSLSVEEAFYCFFPLLCLLLRSRAQLAILLVAFVVAGPFARVAPGANEIWTDHSYLSCMGEIAMGCLAALAAQRWQRTSRASVALLIVGLCLMSFILVFRRTAFAWGLSELGLNVSLLALGVALVLIALNANPNWNSAADFPLVRALRWFGKHSYEIYLSHLFLLLPVVSVFKRMEGASVVALYVLTLLASGALGALLAKYFSEPLNHALRSALFPRARRSQVESLGREP